MEKLNLDDQQEVSQDETSSPEVPEIQVPEDSANSPTQAEEQAFLADISPGLSPRSPTEAEDDPRTEYGKLEATKWPVYNYDTKGGKGIAIKHDDLGTFWRIEFTSGGQLPKELSGRYTNDGEAKFAVEQYLARQL